MGRPKIKVIDDSQPNENQESSRQKRTSPKAGIKNQGKKQETKPVESVVEENNSVILNEVKDLPSLVNNPISEDSSSQAPQNDNAKKQTKPGKSKPRSKKYKEKIADLDRQQNYSLNEALAKVKELSYSKFPGTLEIHINTRQSGLRGLVTLPFASGKKLTILAFGKGAETSGTDIVGDEAIIEEIGKGKINFDLVVTTPDWMPKLAKVAKNLGPRGLMPSPKNGTITTDLKKTVEGFQAGKTEYKSESKAQLIHLALGKLNQPDEELAANVKTLLVTIGKSRIKKVTLAPTIGPSLKLDLNSI